MLRQGGLVFGDLGVRRGTWPALLAWMVLGACAIASAQNACQKDEVFGGYAALIPNGWGDLDYKVNTIPNAFDVSNTYYLPNAHNVGLVLDGSGHFKGSTTPPNLQNGSNDSTGVGYALGGLQYKWHGGAVSPFVRGFLGAANISPDCCHGTEWSFAGGGGGGLDWNVTPRVSIRFAQADYIYSTYSHVFPSTHSTAWNSVRLGAGVVFNLGNYCTQAPVACTASASPSEVNAGEPVRLSSSGSNFNPKHTLTYGWTSSGGKIGNPANQASEVDTTGLAPGTYAITAMITDPKMKQGNSASCPATFIVKPPPPQLPPVVSCAVDPTMIDPGQIATVTMTATSPDRRPMTFRWTSTGGTLNGTGTTATVTAGKSDAGNTITVTGTATDDRSLTASCDVHVSVPKAPEPCVKIVDWGECTFEKNPGRPSRVDNVCKDTLDQLILKMQGTQNGKLIVVGYVDQSEAKSSTLAAQRAANVVYYLTTDSSPTVDASRIEAHQGGVQGKVTHFYFVPEGKLCEGQGDLGTQVDSSKVKGQTRKVPAKKKVEQSQ
jgi:hypothetical protein